MRTRAYIRIVLAIVIGVGVTHIARSAQGYQSPYERFEGCEKDLSGISDPEGMTVVSSQDGFLVVMDSSGEAVLCATRYDAYYDVDSYSRNSVYYTASRQERCGGRSCFRKVLVKLNLSSGEREVVLSRHSSTDEGGGWHDSEKHGDIYFITGTQRDAVFRFNASSREYVRIWDPSSLPGETLGGEVGHINDVEIHGDVVTVSLKELETVAFFDRSSGRLLERTTSRGFRELVMGQHNPDLLPGGNLLLANSMNHSVMEFSWNGSVWEQVWKWRDSRLNWPRDADRLPGGHTLVTDSYGQRILEVDETGRVVWQRNVSVPYEAERLGTGRESKEGRGADELGLEDRFPPTDELVFKQKGDITGPLWYGVVRPLLEPLGLEKWKRFAPGWFGPDGLLALLVSASSAFSWVLLELRWSGVDLVGRVL